MEFALLQESFKAKLAAVLPTVAKATMPILETIRIEAGENGVSFAATDLSTTTLVHCGGRVERPGIACVDAKRLNDVIAKLSNDRVLCSVENNKLTIQCGSAKATLPTMEGDEFPFLPTQGTSCEVRYSDVLAIAHQVSLAAATDETRPVLRGINISSNGNLQAEAADGFRCARFTRPIAGDDHIQIAALVPRTFWAKALRAMAHLKLDEDAPIRLGAGSMVTEGFDRAGQFALDAGFVQVWSQMIEGRFPDINAILPTSFATRAVLDAGQLRRALELARVYAAESSNIVRITVETNGEYGSVVISANAAQIGDSSVRLDALVAGEPTSIALNIAMLIEGLAAIPQPQIAVELVEPRRPALFRGVGDDFHFYLQMPMTTR